MRRAFEVEAMIDRPVEYVWAELIAWDRASRWMNGVDSIRAADGTRLGGVLTFDARGKSRQSTIAALETGRSITLETVQGAVMARYTYRLDPDGGRTRALLTADLGVAASPWRIAEPLLRILVRWTDSGQLDKLKAVVEHE